MKNLKIVFIATILLSIYNFTHALQIEPMEMVQPTSQEATPTEEKTELQQWNEHLRALVKQGTHWNASDNVPSDDWQTDAFTFAKAALNKNTTIAETLKSSFFDTITEKIEQEGGKFSSQTFALVKKFNDMIDEQLQPQKIDSGVEKKEPIVTQEIAAPSEEVKVEPAPLATPAPETVPAPVETVATQAAPQDPLNAWREHLEKIKTEGTTEKTVKALCVQAYTLAQKLLPSNDPHILQSEFEAAIQEHNRRPDLSFIDSAAAISVFNEIVGLAQQTPQQQASRFDQLRATPVDGEIQKLRQEFDEQQKSAKAQHEQEIEKLNQKAMMMTESIKQAENAEKITKENAQHFQKKLEENMKEKLAQFNAQAEARQAAAQQEFTQAMDKAQAMQQRVAVARKTPQVEQGMLGSAFEAVTKVARTAAGKVSELWYGPQTPAATVETEEDKLQRAADAEELNSLAKYLDSLDQKKMPQEKKEAIEKDWALLQQELRVAPHIVSQKNREATKGLLSTICTILDRLIFSHKIISLHDARTKIANILEASYSRAVMQPLEEKQQTIKMQEIEADSAKEQQAQQIKERKEKIALAQQKIKDEENRKETEQKNRLMAAASYKDEKKQWNQLLAQLSQNKQATAEENKAHTLEAIKKSQSLLSLAQNIPSKNRPVISQKLKQKFTVALLDQQKLTNDNQLNIHQHMDQFNNELNKMVE